MTKTDDKIAPQQVNYKNPTLIGLLASAFLTALVIIGSRNLEHFDSALFGYTVASVVAFGAIFFRYAIWLQRPATRTYFRRGLQLFFQRKKFKWTVLSSKGTNLKKAEQSRIIDLERPGGFAVLPGEMYITGSATEGGAVLASALKMRQVSPGVFEIFSKIKPGTYQFTDGIGATANKFYIFDDNGINAIGANGQTTYAGSEKIMRITLDFNNINASYLEVKSVQFWYCIGNQFWFTLPYTSNGIWRFNGRTVNLTMASWGSLEERYKYKMVVNDGSGDKDLWLNSNFGDPAGQDGQYPGTAAYRTINLTKNEGSQWDWGWKLDRNYLTQGTVADFWVSLRGSDGVYTQNYQKQ